MIPEISEYFTSGAFREVSQHLHRSSRVSINPRWTLGHLPLRPGGSVPHYDLVLADPP